MIGEKAVFALTAPAVFDGQGWLRDHCIVVRGPRIEAVMPLERCPPDIALNRLAEGTLAPGFVDLQVNGGGDVLFNNAPRPETLRIMQAAHRSRGTTAMLPTLLSDTRETLTDALASVAMLFREDNGGVLGLHVEGPFFPVARRGAHRANDLRLPQEADLELLCARRDFALLLTAAPECLAPEQLARLVAAGVQVWAGHSDATAEEVARAAEVGLRGVTHLFNAMPPVGARSPGLAGAALALDGLWAGIIADGHHVHDTALALAQRCKPAGKLILVSDAMATVGGNRGAFELYGEVIREQGGRLVNAEGRLAGSAIGLIDAVRHMHRRVGLPLEVVLPMASLYPAQALGLDRSLGRLRPGYRADMVHFDDALQVRHTWVGGEVAVHG